MTNKSDHPSPTALEEISGALDALRTNQRQLDQDGVFVGVSRQALDEVLTHIAALEAQLSTRLPTEAQISYLLEVLAREGVTNGGGDFMRRKISKAILALLSGAATPASTAALTEDELARAIDPAAYAHEPEVCESCAKDQIAANSQAKRVMSLLREKGVVKP